MGFEDLLRRRLGPLSDLVLRSPRTVAAPVDPQTLYYRRAAGLEVRVRPEETWAELMVGEAPQLKSRPTEDALSVLGLTEWTPADRGPVDATTLWRAVEDGLLVYARSDPKRPLSGRSRQLEAVESEDRNLARRASAWPTVAVENAVEVAPMPFMPRGLDLVGADAVGARIASLEKGHEVFGVTITGSSATGGRLRRLMAGLDGRRTRRELVASFGRDGHEVTKLLRLLDGLGLLELREGPPAPAEALRAPDRPQVTWLGHAAVLVQTPSTSVLVDPLFFAPSDPPDEWDSHPRFDPRALPPLDAILITHGDNDHLNPNSLGLLDPETPVLIPALPAYPAGFQVDLKGVLRVLGYRRIIEMSVGSGHRVGDLLVTAWPFEGENWGLDLAQVTYLVESEALSVYLSADALRMDETMTAIASRARPVDVAFMGVSGNAEPHVTAPELGYGNFYAEWIPPARHREWVQHCAGPADAVQSVRRLRPRFAFGYAAGGASYIRTAYSDHGDHATFARLLEGADGPTRPVNLPIGRPVAVADLDGYTGPPTDV